MIVLDRFTKFFHKGSVNQVLALDRIDLAVDRGDFITVIGSNGAGKSTLLNALAGTFFPDSGTIRLGPRDITLLPEHRRAEFTGRVFQDPLLGTCAALSIEQNLSIALGRGARRGLKKGVTARHRERFRNELSKIGLGLEDRLGDRVGLLSGGQRQALTMLMATLRRPELLLLDEHTAALDPRTGRQIIDLTRQIVEEKQLTTLMVTHNMNQALDLGNRLIMIHRGRILLDAKGARKSALTVEDLLARFYEARGERFSSDRMLLA